MNATSQVLGFASPPLLHDFGGRVDGVHPPQLLTVLSDRANGLGSHVGPAPAHVAQASVDAVHQVPRFPYSLHLFFVFGTLVASRGHVLNLLALALLARGVV